MTNADKIRGFTTTELAHYLLHECPVDSGKADDVTDSMFEETCKRCPFLGLCPAPEKLDEMVEWLKKEAETV